MNFDRVDETVRGRSSAQRYARVSSESRSIVTEIGDWKLEMEIGVSRTKRKSICCRWGQVCVDDIDLVRSLCVDAVSTWVSFGLGNAGRAPARTPRERTRVSKRERTLRHEAWFPVRYSTARAGCVVVVASNRVSSKIMKTDTVRSALSSTRERERRVLVRSQLLRERGARANGALSGVFPIDRIESIEGRARDAATRERGEACVL